jgi:hypothetical protein
MRLDRDHDRADSRAPVTLRPRPIPSPRDAAIRRAIPVVIAGFAVAGSALAVLALYWLVAHDGSGVTSPYFDSDVALLTGVAIAACGALALMVRRNRAQQEEIERLD